MSRRTTRQIIWDIKQHKKLCACYGTTFIDGIPTENRRMVENQFRANFNDWWNTWIAPCLDELEAKLPKKSSQKQ